MISLQFFENCYTHQVIYSVEVSTPAIFIYGSNIHMLCMGCFPHGILRTDYDLQQMATVAASTL